MVNKPVRRPHCFLMRQHIIEIQTCIAVYCMCTVAVAVFKRVRVPSKEVARTSLNRTPKTEVMIARRARHRPCYKAFFALQILWRPATVEGTPRHNIFANPCAHFHGANQARPLAFRADVAQKKRGIIANMLGSIRDTQALCRVNGRSPLMRKPQAKRSK